MTTATATDESVDGQVKGMVFDDVDAIRQEKIEEQKQKLLKQAKAEEAAAEEAKKGNPSVVTTEVPAVPNGGTPSTPSAPTETVDSLRAENARQTARLAELERRVSDEGRRGHDLELLRQDRVKLAEMLDAQARKVAELEQRLANPPPPPEPEFALSRSVREALGAEDADRLEKEIRTLKKAVQSKPAADAGLTKDLEAIKAEAATARTVAARTAWNTYIRDLTAAVPGFADLVKMPEYAEFFDQRLRGSPYKRGDIISDAEKNLDVTTVAEHLLDFAEQVKGKRPAAAAATPPKPTADETVAAPASAAPAPAVKPGTVKKLTPSEIKDKQAEADKYFDMAISGGNLSREDRTKYKAKADALYAEIDAANKAT